MWAQNQHHQPCSLVPRLSLLRREPGDEAISHALVPENHTAVFEHVLRDHMCHLNMSPDDVTSPADGLHRYDYRRRRLRTVAGLAAKSGTPSEVNAALE